MACLAGSTIYKMIDSGRLAARELPRRQTPFGASEPIFLVEAGDAPFYLMPRHGPGLQRPAPWHVNYRANLYALKDIGVRAVVSWSAAGAISHNLTLGQLVLPDDLIDMTRRRPNTFFEKSCLGFLRQFPVFCTSLVRVVAQVLGEMKLPVQAGGIVAVTEGPRLETPAEVRMLATAGAQLVTHTIAPDVFLAKELELCYAGICCVINYAETRSWHRPFPIGELFGGLTRASQAEQIAAAMNALPQLLSALAARVAAADCRCDCGQSMADNVRRYGLPNDWREWFE
jgi:5'-methylthioadenosine phosphorylase